MRKLNWPFILKDLAKLLALIVLVWLTFTLSKGGN